MKNLHVFLELTESLFALSMHCRVFVLEEFFETRRRRHFELLKPTYRDGLDGEHRTDKKEDGKSLTDRHCILCLVCWCKNENRRM